MNAMPQWISTGYFVFTGGTYQTMKRNELNYARRGSDYLDRMSHAFRKLKPWQREEFDRWGLQPTSKRDSEWPGRVKYTNLRARPDAFALVVLERGPA